MQQQLAVQLARQVRKTAALASQRQGEVSRHAPSEVSGDRPPTNTLRALGFSSCGTDFLASIWQCAKVGGEAGQCGCVTAWRERSGRPHQRPVLVTQRLVAAIQQLPCAQGSILASPASDKLQQREGLLQQQQLAHRRRTWRPSITCTSSTTASAAAGLVKVTNPKPRGRPVWRSRMTTCGAVESSRLLGLGCWRTGDPAWGLPPPLTHRFHDGAILAEVVAQLFCRCGGGWAGKGLGALKRFPIEPHPSPDARILTLGRVPRKTAQEQLG